MDIGATAKIATSGIKVIPGVAEWLRNKLRIREEITYSKELLGVDQNQKFNYRVSMDHPLLQQGIPHVDDLSAFADIAGPSIDHARAAGWIEYPEDIEADLNAGMVLIGSPEAEALTRLVFGYRKLPGSAGVEHLGDVVDLPFCWREDARLVEAQCSRFVPGRGLVTRPNWPIVDNTGARAKLLWPTLSNDGYLTSDFLLITRVPNFLTIEAQQSGRSIVSVAGTHGVGTRAVGVLLRDRTVLREIARKVPPGTEAFQILVEACSIVHNTRGSIARRVIVRDIRCFSRPDEDWSRARGIVHKRYTDWASDIVTARRMAVPDTLPETATGQPDERYGIAAY